MAFIEWDDRFSTGLELFDTHHRTLLGLLNTAYDSYINAPPEEQLGSILTELHQYAIYHFTAEESWMSAVNYPMRESHVVEHQQFTRTVDEFQQSLATGSEVTLLDVLTFLKKWLRHHILVVDAEYARYHEQLKIHISRQRDGG